MSDSVYPSQEQTNYANLLFYGCWIGLAVMLVTYLLYVTELLPPHVPLNEITVYWTKPVGHYLENAHAPQGWSWLNLLGKGDYVNFIGIVLLAGMSILCYLRIIPALLRKGDKPMVIIAVLEVLVLIVAASGIVGAGGH